MQLENQKRKTYPQTAIPIIVSRGGESHSFDSCKQAAFFLSKREHYTVSSVEYHFRKRRKEIFGWRINYQR